MVIIDTSILIGLEMTGVHSTVLDEYNVHTTETVLTELQEIGTQNDGDGNAANAARSKRDRMTVHSTDSGQFRSSRIDAGEGSCAVRADEIGAGYLITDDLHALPELQSVTSATVAISPILLKALVKRGVLDDGEARRMVEDSLLLGAGSMHPSSVEHCGCSRTSAIPDPAPIVKQLRTASRG